jgi:hypothetical protein
MAAHSKKDHKSRAYTEKKNYKQLTFFGVGINTQKV